MRFTICVMVAATVGLVGCSSKKASPPDATTVTDSTSSLAYASPEATFQTLKDAIQQKDYESFCDCWAPEGLALLSGGAAMGVSMFAAQLEKNAEGESPEAKVAQERIERMQKMLIDNGLPDAKLPDAHFIAGNNAPKPIQEQINDHMLSLAANIGDKRAFVADFITIVHETDEGQNYMMLTDEAKLADVKIDGDKATGTIRKTTDDDARVIPAIFVKVAGEWKLLEAKGLKM